MAGPAWYFGQRYEKPTIGDALRSAEPEDIRRAGRTMAFAGGLLLAGVRGHPARRSSWEGYDE